MKVSREKLRFTASEGGKGGIAINLRGMDLEGVNELTLTMEDIEAVAARRQADDDQVAKLRALLGE